MVRRTNEVFFNHLTKKDLFEKVKTKHVATKYIKKKYCK